MQGAQGTLIKATLPIVQLANNLLSARDRKASLDTEAAVQDCMEHLVLTSAAQSQIDQYRRDQFKVLLPNDLRSLASDPKDVSKLLFGDNLEKRIQELTAQSKLKASLRQGETSKSHTHFKVGGYDSQKYSKNSRSFPKSQKPTQGKLQLQKKWVHSNYRSIGNQY